MNRSKTIVTGLKGINYIKTLLNNNGDIFQKIEGENDIGFDGYIEFIKDSKSLNYTVACQIKTGKSYFKNDSIYISSDKNHFEYWNKHNMYSFLIVYNDVTQKCYWIDLSKYLKAHNNETYIVKHDLANELNENTYDIFKKYVMETKEQDISLAKVLNISEKLLINDDEKLSDDVIRLLINYKNFALIWTIVYQKFLISKNEEVLLDLIYFMGWTTSNPDMNWNKTNWIEESRRKFLYDLIEKTDKVTFINKLLIVSTIEKVEFQRGGAGQSIYHILSKIKGYEDILIEIIKSGKDDLKENALFFLMLYKEYSFISSHIHLVDLLFDNGIFNKEIYVRYKSHLKNFGCFYF